MADEIEIQPVYENESDIPEGFRPLYTETDDGYVATFAGGRRFEDVTGLKNTNKAVRRERDTFKTKAQQIEAEREELRAKLEELESRGSSNGKKPTERESEQIAKLQAKYEAQIAKLQEENTTTNTRFAKTMTDAAILGGLPKGMDGKVGTRILRGIVRTVRNEDGNFETKVFESEDATTPRMSEKPGSADDMSLAEFFKDVFPNEYKDYIPGSGASGGGAQGGEGGAGRVAAGSKDVVISRKDAKDPRAYRIARARAEKSGGTVVIQ